MHHPLSEATMSAWTEEARRVHRRYLLEIVEGCGLCPWAERARVDGRVRERVFLDDDPEEIAPSLDALAELVVDASAEVAFFVYPRLALDRRGFERFVASLREADAKRHALGDIPYVLAAFHPDAQPDTAQAERLVPFLRRTPDPTIQLLRAASLERVRGGAPQGTQFVDSSSIEMLWEEAVIPLRERIARANLVTATRMGIDVLAARLDDIRRDRDAAYAALLLRETA